MVRITVKNGLEFDLINSKSHIVEKAVPGHTYRFKGQHCIRSSALQEFPELRIENCAGCDRLNKATQIG